MKKWKGLLYGIVYGLVARGIFAMEAHVIPFSGLMSFTFIFLVPFIIGLITAYYHDTEINATRVMRLAMPVFAIIGFVAISVAFGTEGIICALMALPIFAVMALLGGLLGVNIFYRNNDRTRLSLVLFVPFIIAPLESYLGLHEKIFTEHTAIVIHATPETVWKHVTRVAEITSAENETSLFQVLGFPRPIKAELDTVAVGGVRKAIFDRGLFFTETVTKVVPYRNLTFTIEADPTSIPPAALDEHVLVGGDYFDVLEGKYEIEPIDVQTIRLHLTSRFRVSTSFNFYSGLWSRLIMRDIQENILGVVRKRSEHDL